MTNKNFFAAFVAAVIVLSSLFTATAATPITKVFTKDQGTIISATVSLVFGNDGKGIDMKRCLLIRTTKGAMAIVFAMEQTVPTKEQIAEAYFAKGYYPDNYNSAYLTKKYNNGVYPVGKWVPAMHNMPQLTDERLVADCVYMSDMFYGKEIVRKVKNMDLRFYRNVIRPYKLSVTDGVLTVSYNNKEVMRLQ